MVLLVCDGAVRTGIILVELHFFLPLGNKFVTKRDIAWLLGLVNSPDIDEGVLLGVLKLIGGLSEANYGKSRFASAARIALDALHSRCHVRCDEFVDCPFPFNVGSGSAPWMGWKHCSSSFAQQTPRMPSGLPRTPSTVLALLPYADWTDSGSLILFFFLCLPRLM